MRQDDHVGADHRQTLVRLLPGALAVMLAAALVAAAWICLPTLFPDWIIRHSPWADQIIRASAAGDSGSEHVGMSRLVELGTAAVPRLIEYLKNPNPGLRRVAADALGNIHDSRGIDPLIDALADPDPIVRSAALRSAYRLGPSFEQRERIVLLRFGK